MQEFSKIKTKNRNNRIKVIPANDLKQVRRLNEQFKKNVFKICF